MTVKNELYRILSLDGGSSWALIEAATLADIYGLDKPGREILANFSLAVANSGGSIVLAGLILNLTPRQILDLLLDEQIRKCIFVLKPWYERITSIGRFRKYRNSDKIAGLRKAFSGILKNSDTEIPLTDINTKFNISTNIIITAFDYDRERVKFFRSNNLSNTGNGAQNVSILEAIHASSSAPVLFFDDPAFFKNTTVRRIQDL